MINLLAMFFRELSLNTLIVHPLCKYLCVNLKETGRLHTFLKPLVNLDEELKQTSMRLDRKSRMLANPCLEFYSGHRLQETPLKLQRMLGF